MNQITACGNVVTQYNNALRWGELNPDEAIPEFISALKSALDGVAMGLLDDHMQHCVLDAARSGGPEGEEKLKEASAAIARLVRS